MKTKVQQAVDAVVKTLAEQTRGDRMSVAEYLDVLEGVRQELHARAEAAVDNLAREMDELED